MLNLSETEDKTQYLEGMRYVLMRLSHKDVCNYVIKIKELANHVPHDI